MNKKILLIDSIAAYREETASQLRAQRLDVHEASCPEDAVDKARGNQFDLVAADNDLSPIKGADLLVQIREFNPKAKLVLIVEPSYRFEGSEKGAVSTNGFQIIMGPVSPHALVARLHRFLTNESSDSDELDTLDEPGSPMPVSERTLPTSGGGTSLESHIKTVRRGYQERLPSELNKLKAALAAAQKNPEPELLQRVHAITHTLHGTAGTLGFQEISDIAGEIDNEIKRFIAGELPTEPRWNAIVTAFRRAETVPDRLSLVVSVEPHTNNVASVLIVDSDEESMRKMSALAHSRCIDIKPAINKEQALDWAAAGRLDGVIIDLACMGEDHIVDCIEILHQVPGMTGVPIALMSDNCSVEHRVAAAHAGATHFLQKPIQGDELAEVVQQFVVARAQGNYRVLIVDDDEPFREHVAAILKEEGFFTTTLGEPKQILETAETVKPDVMLLDVMMPDISGFDVCRMLRSTTMWKEIPILFLTAESDPKVRLECFRAGGDDYIKKPVLKEELLARIEVRLERIRLYKDRADKDALTSLPSRRAFIEMFKVRIAEGIRYKRPVTLCLLDIDRFKYVNDTYGHLAGDRVLAGLGKLLGNRFRATDIRGRWGGEEFTVVFYGEDRLTAKMILSRVLEEFSHIEFEGDKGEKFFCTFSCGAAELPGDGNTSDDLFRTSDERLYTAKKTGRNRIVTE